LMTWDVELGAIVALLCRVRRAIRVHLVDDPSGGIVGVWETLAFNDDVVDSQEDGARLVANPRLARAGDGSDFPEHDGFPKRRKGAGVFFHGSPLGKAEVCLGSHNPSIGKEHNSCEEYQ
jgi:hypothetical protein